MSTWIITLGLIYWITLFSPGHCQQLSENTPPILWLDRNWVVSELEPVGSIVARVNARDDQDDPLEFGLEPHAGFGSVGVSNRSLSFRIDNETGTVYTNESLVGRRKEAERNIMRDDHILMQQWHGPRAFNNRYEGWQENSMIQNTNILNDPILTAKSDDKWEVPRHHIKVFNILGEGCFGQVWKCEALNIDGREGPSIVAVKTLKENAGERERLDLLQELTVMKTLEPHPNVVRLLGCCTEKEPFFVIMEFVMFGKLQSFLRNSRAQRYYNNMHGKSNSLTSRDLTSFCYQVARGMQFLSSRGIIHRDLAARNVLIGENHCCKVADFGFARDLMTSSVYERKSEGRLPIRWMSPEALYDNIFSVKSDIWSFGVLIWEIVTLGSTPYPGMAAADVMKKVRDGYRLEKPDHCRRELYNIMYYCWDKEPNERPNFKELCDLLEKLILTETEYIELERFPDHSYYNMVSLSGEKL
uniref:receptor protein-tyrosine kinase n=1 Tax=Cacopsylla melanoneura TaxID=428564 RepID=A0A8D8YNY4_9HEMI